MTQQSNPKKSALWFLVDGLSPRYLAGHGNTWIDTPNFDRLMSEAQSFENAVADSIELHTGLRAFIAGQHATHSGEPVRQLIESFQNGGVECFLISDDRAMVETAGIAGMFDEFLALDIPLTSDLVTSEGQSHLAGCLAQIMDELPRRVAPYLCIVVLTSLSRTWDAPYAWREKFVEQGDPQPPTDVQPAVGTFLEEPPHPDELLGFSRAYAAQVELLDHCLGVFLEEMDSLGLLTDMFFGLTAIRGYPLGEHRYVGHHANLFHGEATHVPLLCRLPNSDLASARHHSLVQPSQVLPALLEWFNASAERPPGHHSLLPHLMQGDGRNDDLVVMYGDIQRAIWTRAWKLIDQPERPLLFVRPDDRWEVNPVGDRCEEVVGELRNLLDRCATRLKSGDSIEMLALSDELKFGFS